MKTYDEQRYPIWAEVRISFRDDTFLDVVKGLNVGHALWRAAWNWDGADISVVASGPAIFVP